MKKGALVAAALGLLAGCKSPVRKDAPAKMLGVKIAEDGEVARVTGSPDGKWVAFLGQVAPSREPNVPEGIFVGMLELVPSDGSGPARSLLGGVTTLDGAFSFSPDSSVLAALRGFRFANHTGALETIALNGKGEPVQVADECSAFFFSPDGKHLAWVAGGNAFVGNADGSSPRKLVDGAATVEFSRDSKKILVRKQASAGGDLLVADVAGGAPRLLAQKVGDYNFAPNGASVAFTTRASGATSGWDLKVVSAEGGTPRALGERVARFTYSPDGKWLGYVANVSPRSFYGELSIAPADGSAAGIKVGEGVASFEFAPGSQAVAFLEHFSDNAKSGTLSVQRLPLTEKPIALHRPCKGFAWSPQGNYLAYSALTLHPSVSLDLELVALKDIKNGAALPDGGAGWGEGARKVAVGVFGFEFLGEDKLLYRSDCVMEGRACDLYTVPTDHPATAGRITGGVWRFAISRDGSRMLVTYPRTDSETVANLGAVNLSGYGGVTGLDERVEPGAVFLDPQGKRAAYGIIDRKRRGVYVADVPLPAPGQLPPSLEPPGFKAVYGGTAH